MLVSVALLGGGDSRVGIKIYKQVPVTLHDMVIVDLVVIIKGMIIMV